MNSELSAGEAERNLWSLNIVKVQARLLWGAYASVVVGNLARWPFWVKFEV